MHGYRLSVRWHISDAVHDNDLEACGPSFGYVERNAPADWVLQGAFVEVEEPGESVKGANDVRIEATKRCEFRGDERTRS